MRTIMMLAGTFLMPIQQAQPALSAAKAATSSVSGDWQGTLSPAPGQSIPIILHVTGAPGHLAATLDSPSQGATGLPIESVVQKGDAVQFELAAPKAGYAATLSPDGRTLSGHWSQGGASIALTMTRTAPAGRAPSVAPQPPRAPFPYRSQEVAFDNVAGRAHLAGTLTLPVGSKPHPAVLLISGSGLQDRNETVFGHQPFLVWADALTRRGVAVLRVDDRQTGGSTGEVHTATTADFAGDAESAVAFLRSRLDIDQRRIGLMGHSEGASIAAMVAASDPAIAFVVMLAGLGESGQDLMLQQKRTIETLRGLSPAMVDQSAGNMRQLYDAVKDAPDQATADASLEAAWQTVAAQGGESGGSMPAELRLIASPWMRWFLRYDPRSTLAQLRCPVLAIGGAKDVQVATDANLAGIARALRANRDVTVVNLPGLNHLFQTAYTGDPAEYGQLKETVAPAALRTVGDWIINRTGRG